MAASFFSINGYHCTNWVAPHSASEHRGNQAPFISLHPLRCLSAIRFPPSLHVYSLLRGNNMDAASTVHCPFTLISSGDNMYGKN